MNLGMFVSRRGRSHWRILGWCRFRGVGQQTTKGDWTTNQKRACAKNVLFSREGSLFLHLLSPSYGPVPRSETPSHGVVPVKLIRLRRPLACHPRSGAKRSGAGSEATLTRQRPDTLSRPSAPLRALGGLCGLCCAHSFWHCASPFAFGSEA